MGDSFVSLFLRSRHTLLRPSLYLYLSSFLVSRGEQIRQLQFYPLQGQNNIIALLKSLICQIFLSFENVFQHYKTLTSLIFYYNLLMFNLQRLGSHIFSGRSVYYYLPWILNYRIVCSDCWVIADWTCCKQSLNTYQSYCLGVRINHSR